MDKESISKLRAEVRRLQKINNILEQENAMLRKLKPEETTRAKKREIENEKKLCPICKSKDYFEVKTPSGIKPTCMTCRTKKLGLTHIKDY